MFQIHPCSKLVRLFIEKPYQGADPEQATFLFIGQDANYSADIEFSPIFEKIFEYHEDGVMFWKKYGVHHPFLLDDYTGDGKYFHRTFAQIGFKSKHAELVSFIELLNVPTIGRNKLEFSDLDPNHLLKIKSLILKTTTKYVFLTSSVLSLLKKSQVFDFLPKIPIYYENNLGVIYKLDEKHIYLHLHFSNYGKFLSKKNSQLESIQKLIPI